MLAGKLCAGALLGALLFLAVANASILFDGPASSQPAIQAAVAQMGAPRNCLLFEADVAGTLYHFDATADRVVTHTFTAAKAGSVEAGGKCMDYAPRSRHSYSQQLWLKFLPRGVKTAGNKWHLELDFQPVSAPNSSDVNGFRLVGASLRAVLPIRGDLEPLASPAATATALYEPVDREEMEALATDRRGVGFSCARGFRLRLTNDSHIDFTRLKVLAYQATPDKYFGTEQKFVECAERPLLDDGMLVLLAAILGALLLVGVAGCALAVCMKHNARRTHNVSVLQEHDGHQVVVAHVNYMPPKA